MGVLGFTPFIQKTCPEVIKTLHNRLRELSGKIIVFDGTLITQRLHFAPAPHRYRHVIGWYRLIKELRDSDVQAICVFDGKERGPAKQAEVARRRHVRRIDAARASIELERLQRLRKLISLLSDYRSLEISQREHATSMLRRLISDTRISTSTIGILSKEHWLSTPATSDPATDALAYRLSGLEDDQATYPFDESEIEQVLTDHTLVSVSSTQHTDTDGFPMSLSPSQSVTGCQDSDRPINQISSRVIAGYQASRASSEPQSIQNDLQSQDVVLSKLQVLHLDDTWLRECVSVPVSARLKMPPDVASALASLYLDYRQSIPTFHSLPSAPLPRPQQGIPLEVSDPQEVRTDYAMSKFQLQLMVDEGKVWEDLAKSGINTSDEGVGETSLALLAERSEVVSRSYERRCNPPTNETYEESRQILRAMGIPCVESSAPFEAEALASVLVIRGYADYVASEDTDVLVYEAPMIRNITNRKGPLIVMSGTDVRTVLHLDKASYIDFALLLGTDFSQRIKNVGPQRALKFIREHGSIERVIECETQYPPRIAPQAYLQQVEIARLVFNTLPPVPDEELLRPQEWDDDGVQTLLQRFGVDHMTAMDDWDYSTALDGNHFHDNPSAY